MNPAQQAEIVDLAARTADRVEIEPGSVWAFQRLLPIGRRQLVEVEQVHGRTITIRYLSTGNVLTTARDAFLLNYVPDPGPPDIDLDDVPAPADAYATWRGKQ